MNTKKVLEAYKGGALMSVSTGVNAYTIYHHDHLVTTFYKQEPTKADLRAEIERLKMQLANVKAEAYEAVAVLNNALDLGIDGL